MSTMDVILLSLVIIYVYSTVQAEINVIGLPKREFSKRDVTRCHIPMPLEHGRYQVNKRVCPESETSALCQLEPGTSTPDLWVLYFYCQPEYESSLVSRASICRRGRWLPSLPVCIPDLHITPLAEWGPVSEPSQFLRQDLPSSRVIIAHTATSPCSTRADCLLSAQSVQQYHIQLFGDIGYNFLVGGDGSVIEGQGWDKIGAHTINYNTGSVCIALIGNFVNSPAPQAAMNAVKKLVERGVGLRKLSSNYKLYAHCQLIQVASPGEKVFDEIKNWPHWNPINALRCTQ